MPLKKFLLTGWFMVLGALYADCYPASMACGVSSGSGCIKPQCAQYCAHVMCQLYGVPVSLRQVCELMPPKAEGESMLEIARFLERAGLDCDGQRLSFDELIAGPFPIVAHMIATKDKEKIAHFLVVERADLSEVKVAEGTGRRGMLSAETFCREWDGYILRVARPAGGLRRPDFVDPNGQSSAWLLFEKLLIDAGDIPQSKNDYVFTFRFTNIGSDKLHIKDVKTTCKCTVVDESFKKIIAPGQTGEILIRYTFGQVRGRFTEYAFVVSDDPYFPYTELRVEGNGLQTVRVSPSRLSFGNVVRGKSAASRCYIIYTGDGLFDVGSVKTDAEQLKVSIEPMTPSLLQELEPGSGGVTFSECRNRFVLEGVIDTKQMELGEPKIGVEISTNLPDPPTVSVPVDIKVISPVVATPSRLFLGEVYAESIISESITVKSLNKSLLRVKSVDLKGTGLECAYPSMDAGIIKLNFTGRGLKQDRVQDKSITVIVTEVESGNSFTIDLPISALFSTS